MAPAMAPVMVDVQHPAVLVGRFMSAPPLLGAAPALPGGQQGVRSAAAAADGAAAREVPLRVNLDDAGAIGSSSQCVWGGDRLDWPGTSLDVPTEMHWLLTRTLSDDGSEAYTLRPVHGWHEFKPPCPEVSRPSGDGVGDAGHRRRSLNSGEQLLLREAQLRQEFADRWAKIVARQRLSTGAGGLKATRQQIHQGLRSKLHSGAAPAGQRLGEKPTPRGNKSVGTRLLQRLEQLEELEEREAQEGRAPHTPGPEEEHAADAPDDARRVAREVEHPEEERLKDDTGLERHRKKKRKALKRQAGAVDRAEDEEVPETANALLQLKSEKGECLWDFHDDDKFHDDEIDRFDFDDQLHLDVDTGRDALPTAEDDMADADDEHVELLLTKHGADLEALLAKHDDDADGDTPQPDAAFDARPKASASAVSDDPQASGAARGSAPPAAAAAAGAASGAAPSGAPWTPDSPGAGGNRAAAAPTAPAASVAPAVPAAAAAGAAPSPSRSTSATSATSSRQQLRQRAIACLQANGGQCSLSVAGAALGLTSPDSPMYKQVVAVLKEVADMRRLPGEARPQLFLRPEFASQAAGVNP